MNVLEKDDLVVGQEIMVCRDLSDYRAIFKGIGLDVEGTEIITLYNKDKGYYDCEILSDLNIYYDICKVG